MQTELEELETQTLETGFWQDQNRAQQITQKMSRLKQSLDQYQKWCNEVSDLSVLVQMGIEENDQSVAAEIQAGCKRLQSELERFEFTKLLSGEYDNSAAIVSINAGAGGTDAQDWAEMMLRMYLRWCQNRGFKTELIDQSPGEEAGIKSATFKVDGPYAYGYLSCEKGVHRLVRKSPYKQGSDSRQTSFAGIEVSPLINDIDSVIDIKDDDIAS